MHYLKVSFFEIFIINHWFFKRADLNSRFFSGRVIRMTAHHQNIFCWNETKNLAFFRVKMLANFFLRILYYFNHQHNYNIKMLITFKNNRDIIFCKFYHEFMCNYSWLFSHTFLSIYYQCVILSSEKIRSKP